MRSTQELLHTEVLMPPRRDPDRLRGMIPQAAEPEGLTIRPSRPADASQAAHLMGLCAPALALTIVGGGRANVAGISRELFPIPNHIYSHSHAFVAEREGGGIVGLFLGLDRRMWEAARSAITRETRIDWLRIVGLPWCCKGTHTVGSARESHASLAGAPAVHSIRAGCQGLTPQ